MEVTEVRNYKFISFTGAGSRLMKRIAQSVLKDDAFKLSIDNEPAINNGNFDVDNGESYIAATNISDLKTWTFNSFSTGNVLVFIGAMGIAVRAIAPFIKDKTTDPAVIVIDEKGEFVIPVLSGHIGGAVLKARKIASLIGAVPVITTATDVEGLFAVDVFATDNGLFISDMKKAKEFSANLLEKKVSSYYADNEYVDPANLMGIADEIKRVDEDINKAELIISPLRIETDALVLIPKCIVVGMGCRKGTDEDKLFEFCKECLTEAGLSIHSVKAVVSADIKKDELGLQGLAKKLEAEFSTFSSEELMEQEGDFSSSEFVRSVTGADNICERSVMAYGCQKLIIKKTARDGMTFAAGVFRA